MDEENQIARTRKLTNCYSSRNLHRIRNDQNVTKKRPKLKIDWIEWKKHTRKLLKETEYLTMPCSQSKNEKRAAKKIQKVTRSYESQTNLNGNRKVSSRFRCSSKCICKLTRNETNKKNRPRCAELKRGIQKTTENSSIATSHAFTRHLYSHHKSRLDENKRKIHFLIRFLSLFALFFLAFQPSVAITLTPSICAIKND